MKPYHLHKQLKFLQKIAPNVTDSSIEEETETTKTRSRYQPYIKPTPPQKQNYDEFERQIIETLSSSENRHMSFFKAILPSLNKLDDHQTLLFQSGVLKMLLDLHQTPNQTATSNSHQQNSRPPQATTSYDYRRSNSSSPSIIHPATPVSPLDEIVFSNTSNTLESEYDFS